jgi:hypothetical protein
MVAARPVDDTLFVAQLEPDLEALWIHPSAPESWAAVYAVLADAFAGLLVTSAAHHRLTHLLLYTLLASDAPQLEAIRDEVRATPPRQWLTHFREVTAARLTHLGEEPHSRPSFHACAQQLAGELERLDQLLDLLEFLATDSTSLRTLVLCVPTPTPTHTQGYWRAGPENLERARQFVRWQLVVLEHEGYPLSELQPIHCNYLAVHALANTPIAEASPLHLPTGAPLEVALAQLYYHMEETPLPLDANSIADFKEALVLLLAEYNTFDSPFATPFLMVLGRLVWGLPKAAEATPDVFDQPSFQDILTFEQGMASTESVMAFIGQCKTYTNDRLQYLHQEGWTPAEYAQRHRQLNAHAHLLSVIQMNLPDFQTSRQPIHDATQQARSRIASGWRWAPAIPYRATPERSFDRALHWLAREVLRLEEEYGLFLLGATHVAIASLAAPAHLLCDAVDGNPALLPLSVLKPVLLQLARLEIARYRYVTQRD